MESAIIDQEAVNVLENGGGFSFKIRILRSIRYDDYAQLIKLLENVRIQEMGEVGKARFVSELLSAMLRFGARVCCEHFLALAPKIGLTVDLNVPLYENELLPIHVAATTPPFQLVKLLLVNGARSDVVCEKLWSKYHSMLPIEAALSRVGENVSWNPTRSVHRLLFSLSGWKYDHSRGLFCAIRALLEHMKDELKQEVINCFVRKEKFVELAALLFADAMVNPGHSVVCSHELIIKLRTSFSEEILSLMEEENKFATNGNGNGKGKLAAITRRKKMLMIALQLLEIFRRTDMSGLGDTNRLAVLVRRIVDADFHLTYDDLPNLDDIIARQKGLGNKISRSERSEVLPSYLQSHALLQKLPMKLRVNQQDPYFALLPFGKRGLSSAVQGFHAARGFNSRFKSVLCTPMDAESQLAKATHPKELHMVNSSLNKKVSLFVAAIKRIMRV